VKHLKKRDKEKKKAERKVNETINKEELLKQGQLSNDSSFTVDEDAESLDSAMAKKHKTLDSVVSSHTDGSQRSYNAMSLVMDVLKDLNSGTNDELDRQLKEQQLAAAKAQADAFSAQAAYYTLLEDLETPILQMMEASSLNTRSLGYHSESHMHFSATSI
jgi:hypothetical protein